MNLSLQFACGLILTVVVALLVVCYLTKPLRKQLQELCGNPDRSEFWTSFSNVTIVLTPAIFSMMAEPAGGPALFAVINQLKWGLIGLGISVLLLGWILSRFLPRPSAASNVLVDARKLETSR